MHFEEKIPTFLRKISKLHNFERFIFNLDFNLGQHLVENFISFKMIYFIVILSAEIAITEKKTNC